MTSVLAERSAKLRGEQEPRIRHVPAHDGSIGWKALELAEMAGLTLDPWQERILETALNEQDGKWAAEEVALVCPRQNGKNEVLVARELAGLFLLGERMILHSAHQNDTSLEAFRRLVDVIEDKPTLVKRVSKVWRANGVEGIELRNGQRIRFATRRGGGRRGFTIDCLILDESMELPEAFYAALRPVVSAVENGQIWLTGSAVDQEVHEHGIVLARTRERGIAGDDPALFYSEWSVDAENPELEHDLTDEELARANPAFGDRIDRDTVRREERAMSRRGFNVERGGIGSWPRTDGLDGVVITPAEWGEWTEKTSQITGPLCVSIDIGPDRDRAAIAVCGFRADGKLHVEVVERKRGRTATVGLVEYALKVTMDHTVLAVIVDGRSPANSLVPELTEKLPVGELHDREITVLTATEHAQACGMLYDAGQQDRLRHIGQPELAEALRGAIKRPLSDAWAWSRINSTVDISPLVACTLALYGAEVFQPGEPQFWNLADFIEEQDEAQT